MSSNQDSSKLNTSKYSRDEAIEIGKRLKQKRELSDLSVSEISKITKISEQFIHDIENGSWEELPNPTITRRLIKSYAKEINCDLSNYNSFSNYTESLEPQPPQENYENIIKFAYLKRNRHKKFFNFNLNLNLIKSKKNIEDTQSTVEQYHNDSTLGEQKSEKNPNYKKWVFLVSSASLGLGAFCVYYLARSDQWDVFSNTQTATVQNENADKIDLPTSQEDLMLDTPEETQIATSENNDSVATDRQEENNFAIPDKQEENNSLNIKHYSQKMTLTILSPVRMNVQADGKDILNGWVEPITMNIEFEKEAILSIEDSSKVKMSYAGWKEEILSFGKRQRTIVLHANPFKNQ